MSQKLASRFYLARSFSNLRAAQEASSLLAKVAICAAQNLHARARPLLASEIVFGFGTHRAITSAYGKIKHNNTIHINSLSLRSVYFLFPSIASSIKSESQTIEVVQRQQSYKHLASSRGGDIMRPSHVQDDDFPLRILVQSNMVGAIIGRSGSTIKQITQETKARIDVHREESSDQQEKVITINGNPESCSLACSKIQEIILNELNQMANTQIDMSNHSDSQQSAKQDEDFFKTVMQLKILAHNNLIGRLIGRNGATIKRIMEYTSTKINISANGITDCTNERTITVVGNLSQLRSAEQIISAKLKAAFQSDMSVTLQAMNQQQYLFNNVPISYMQGPYGQNPILSSLVNSQPNQSGHVANRPRSTAAHQGQLPGSHLYPNTPGYLSMYPNLPVPQGPGVLRFNPTMPSMGIEKETVHIYIPNSMVGAVIGKSGSAIKEMINQSGASIKVAPLPPQADQPPTNSSSTTSTNTNSSTLPDVQTASIEDEAVTQAQDARSETKYDSNHEEGEVDSSLKEGRSHVTQSTSIPRPSNSLDGQTVTRKVTVVGSPESVMSAQYLIYRKVATESRKSDISLMVEIHVPSKLVGKIIGKGGATVKQIQKLSRATIRLPDERPSSSETENENETTVQITGDFHSSQTAQRHVRSLI